MKFENLLSQGKIGSLVLKNRIIMPAMGNSLSNERGDDVSDPKAYYQERAKGGTGLIITGVCRIDPDGSAIGNQLSAYNLSHVGGLKKIADGVHRYDGRIFLQLHHAGRQANTMVTGKEPVGPSAIAVPSPMAPFPVPRALTIDEIKELVGKFIFGAVIAKMGHFDGVEVHCAHGYLLNQFLSSFSNQRTDEYGGSLENRLRIVKEIITGIKAQCGPNFPVSVRISADEFVDGGIRVDEAILIAQELEKYGADLINVSGGGYQAAYGVIAPSMFEEGWMVPLAEAVKKAVKVPVAAVSQIRDFDYAESIIADGKCDFVCMGRPHIADPYFVNKLASGRLKEIRRCICCLHCNDELNTSRLECSVNPVVGYESEFTHLEKNGGERPVVVVGAGPGGCEAARVLAMRGFKVTLLEKSNQIGGQINLAAVPPTKFRMNWIIEYYESNLKRLGVDIRLNQEATVEEIEKLNPYAIFLGSGSTPIIPSIPGVDSGNVCTAEDVLSGKVQLKDKKVLMVGSGNTGLETVEYLSQFDNNITLVEMLPQVGMLASSSGAYTLGSILQKGLDLLPGHMLKSVKDKDVELMNLSTNETVTKEFDNVVLAIGVRKSNPLEQDLVGKFNNINIIGDAYQIGKIASAVKRGFQKGFYLDKNFEEV